jgi:hypothetical protein
MILFNSTIAQCMTVHLIMFAAKNKFMDPKNCLENREKLTRQCVKFDQSEIQSKKVKIAAHFLVFLVHFTRTQFYFFVYLF